MTSLPAQRKRPPQLLTIPTFQGKKRRPERRGKASSRLPASVRLRPRLALAGALPWPKMPLPVCLSQPTPSPSAALSSLQTSPAHPKDSSSSYHSVLFREFTLSDSPYWCAQATTLAVPWTKASRKPSRRRRLNLPTSRSTAKFLVRAVQYRPERFFP